MKKAIVLFIGLLAIASASCDGTLTRQFGGSMKITLPPGRKLINVTWKTDDAWYLTRPMRPDEKPETYEFNERSNFGIFEGTVTIVESR